MPKDDKPPVIAPIAPAKRRSGTKSPRSLGTLLWSEKSGGLFHEETRKSKRKYVGLTAEEWGFFCGVAGVNGFDRFSLLKRFNIDIQRKEKASYLTRMLS